MSTFQGSKAGGWYYLNLSITGCHRIYHFKDFTCITCIPPVSINSGKTHQISPAHFLVFRGFLAKCLADFQDWLYYHLPSRPVHYTNMFRRFFCSGPVSQTQKRDKKRGGPENYGTSPSVPDP